MAGIYKVWCNVEQKFVSGYFDTLQYLSKQLATL
jgi:hypothetical protein